MTLISYPIAGPAQRLKPAADGLVRLRLTIADVDWAGRARSDQPLVVDTDPDHGLTEQQASQIEQAGAVYGQLIGGTQAQLILGVQPDWSAGYTRPHTCRHCGRCSWNLNDVKQRYCGACHKFTTNI